MRDWFLRYNRRFKSLGWACEGLLAQRLCSAFEERGHILAEICAIRGDLPLFRLEYILAPDNVPTGPRAFHIRGKK